MATSKQTSMDACQIDTSRLDFAKVDAAAGKIISDLAGSFATIAGAIGDRYGLFKSLYDRPANSIELAARTGLDERYLREWLHGMHAVSWITAGDDRRFYLTPEQAFVLAQEGGPCFFGGGLQEWMGAARQFDAITDSFVTGKGVHPEHYHQDLWQGLSRFTAGWFENLVVQDWLPRVPHVFEKLQKGAVVADVGCGRGLGVVRLAQAFPKSRFVGIDIHAPSIEAARALAEKEGVADRVAFRIADAAEGIEGTYDVVTMFDVLHDSADPPSLLRGIRNSLAPGGTLLCIEINCKDDPLDNKGAIAGLLYGFSLLYCMTSSVGQGGAGLGTLGIPPTVAHRLFKESGYTASRLVDLGNNPFNVMYEAVA